MYRHCAASPFFGRCGKTSAEPSVLLMLLPLLADAVEMFWPLRRFVLIEFRAPRFRLHPLEYSWKKCPISKCGFLARSKPQKILALWSVFAAIFLNFEVKKVEQEYQKDGDSID